MRLWMVIALAALPLLAACQDNPAEEFGYRLDKQGTPEPPSDMLRLPQAATPPLNPVARATSM